MAEVDTHIRIKLGELEVEYKGDASFFKKDLLETVKELLELQIVVQQASSGTGGDAGGAGGGGGEFNQSTETIANILGAKSGSGLVIAAAAHLHFVKKKQTFTRKNILAEMQTAPGHWKNTYVNNLTTYLDTLRGKKDRLRLISKDTFALSTKERAELGAKLAEDR